MSSFIMPKAEVVVLFDLIGASSVPVGIGDLPQVDEFERERIVESFSVNRLIDKDREIFRLNKGFEQFLIPIVKAEKIMIFNYGVGGSCIFNASMYFAKSGLVAVLDEAEGMIKFLTIDSLDDLLLFIPDITEDAAPIEGVKPYISYLLVDKGFSIVHCTVIDSENNIARIVEGERTPGVTPIEAIDEAAISEYKVMLHDKLKEVYNVISS